MPVLLILIATLNAILCGYQLTQAFSVEKTSPARTGNLIFAGLSGLTSFILLLTATTSTWTC